MRPREQVQTVWLVFAGLAIGLVYLYSGFVPRHEWLIAPAVGGGVVCAFWLGLSCSRTISPARRLSSAIFWVSAFCVLLMLPAALRWAWLRGEAASIPVASDAMSIHREINVVRFEGKEPFLVGYVTRLSSTKVNELLVDGFADNGWTIDIISDPDEFHDLYPWVVGTRLNLHTKGVRLRQDGPSDGVRLQQVYTIHRGQRYAQVCVLDAGTERWVYADAYHDTAPRWARRLGL